jgi:hypothetical protein
MNSSVGGYYDVRAILAEDTDVPVTFATGVVEIGKILDPSGGEKDLAKGTKTKLPLWLVGPMAQRHMIHVRSAHMFGKDKGQYTTIQEDNAKVYSVDLLALKANPSEFALQSTKGLWAGNKIQYAGRC